jgi:hypothetical protein
VGVWGIRYEENLIVQMISLNIDVLMTDIPHKVQEKLHT